MNLNEYLNGALEAQRVPDAEIEALRQHRKDVEAMLREKYGNVPKIKYGGSHAKGTMIKDSFDLDVLCYFPADDHTAGDTLEEIFESVRSTLGEKYFVVTKRCALRLHNIDSKQPNRDYHVDVVPGRDADGDSGDTWLHVSTPDKKRLKTNIDKHIEHIKSSKRTAEIRLAKLWNLRRGLNVPTFALELLVVKALRDEPSTTLADSMVAFWTYLRDRESLSIDDPANPGGNDLSDMLNEATQAILRNAASSALAAVDREDWPSLLGPVEKKANSTRVTSAVAGASIAKPWCE